MKAIDTFSSPIPVKKEINQKIFYFTFLLFNWLISAVLIFAGVSKIVDMEALKEKTKASLRGNKVI